jgi:acetolactate synthase-1/2/3 large subunit
VVAIGARFSDQHTSNWRPGRIYNVPRTKIVQVDLDVDEIGRTYPVEVGILADAQTAISDLVTATEPVALAPRWRSWVAEVARLRGAWQDELRPLLANDSVPIHPARLMHEVGEAIASRGRVLIDIGDSISYAEPYMTIRRPGAWYIMPAFAEMGSASTGVLGALVGDPSQPAIAVVGDGAFNMTSHILAPAVEYELPAVWVISNNGELGIERKASVGLFDRTHPWVRFTRKDTGEPYNPDYIKLAQAYGAEAERVEDPKQLRAALQRAIESPSPYVLDVPTDTGTPTYFTPGLDRSYPNSWSETYPQYIELTIGGS